MVLAAFLLWWCCVSFGVLSSHLLPPPPPLPLPLAKTQQVLQKVKVEYEVLAGWDEDISECKDWDDLPTNAQVYVRRVEVREARGATYRGV